MAAPAATACAKDVWTKVATNVTDGTLVIVEGPFMKLWTYVLTGVAKPADSDKTNAATILDDQSFSFGAAVDLYFMPIGKSGNVSVWT